MSNRDQRPMRGSPLFRRVRTRELDSSSEDGTLVMLPPKKFTRPLQHTRSRGRGRPTSPTAEDEYLRSFTSPSSKASGSSSRILTKEEFEDEDYDPSHLTDRSKGQREPSPRRQTSQKTSPKRIRIPSARPRKVVPPPVPEEEAPQKRAAEEHAGPRRAKEESRHAFSPPRLPRMEGTGKDHALLSLASSHVSIRSLTPATSSRSERSGRGSSFFRPVKAQDLNSEAGKGTLVMLSPEKLTRPLHHTRPQGRPVSPPASDDYLRSFTSQSSKPSTSSSQPLTKEEFEDEDFDPRSPRGRMKRKQEPTPGRQSSRNTFPERRYVPSDQPRKVVPPPLPTEETLEKREAEGDTGPKRAREESWSPSNPKKLLHKKGTEVSSKTIATSFKKRASKSSLEPSARARCSTAPQLPLGADSDPDTVPASAPARHSGSGASRRKQDKSTVKRHPQGYQVLREIRRLQRTTHLLLPRLPFSRVVRDFVEGQFTRDAHVIAGHSGPPGGSRGPPGQCDGWSIHVRQTRQPQDAHVKRPHVLSSAEQAAKGVGYLNICSCRSTLMIKFGKRRDAPLCIK